ncbi:MAG: hypothetical protein C5B59_01380 [Bacteroidetes bacterium]|nr:MAG: hypothetical protein C5B59_01380 [Bacteroidota bacterium]
MTKDFGQPEDLLTDESFLAWYYKSNPEDVETWNQWIGDDPYRKELVSRAIELLSVLHISEKQVAVSQLQVAEEELLHQIDLLHNKTTIGWRRYFWLAAACVLAAGSFFLMKSFFFTKSAIITKYGEIREQVLADGTNIKMNANSRLSYDASWKDGVDREVWLTGEAFFHVKKTPMKSRFIVHTDHFDVIVTGTQFNVVNRNGKSNVMLNEGSVIVRSSNGSDLPMVPGEFVEFGQNGTQKRSVRYDSLLAWKDSRIVFDNTPIKEVVVIIKEHYGVKVNLADDQVGNKTISGMLPNDNLDVLLQAMDATNDLEVVRHDNEISIRNRQ